jgi:hypothetical protein
VLAIALLLTGMLMPAMTGIKENARRVVCSSNQRQMGLSIHAYAGDNNERLPYTKWLPREAELTMPSPQELMMANTGEGGMQGWDGIGLLYWRDYCGAPGCYYCPSHHGNHNEEDYAEHWNRNLAGEDHDPVYTNYHYAGDMTWGQNRVPRRLHTDSGMLLLTDGLRTKSDFSHDVGMNVVRADGSVQWIEDQGDIYDELPDDDVFNDAEVMQYQTLWQIVEDTSKNQ